MNPYKKDKGTLGVMSAFVAVTVVRTAVMPFCYPFDTIRRRMMLRPKTPVADRLYKRSFHCATEILKKEGIKGMYRGMAPVIARGGGGSVVLLGYDRAKEIFNL
eukprot:PhM_4_TR9168/c0_g1_i1/m.94472/K05863/SLC25A4S, ANT; solute carrier family 25 (mitochondrial adenine nucleotide translocator), member 4/5/6/31